MRNRFRYTAWLPDERKTALILACIAAGEGIWAYYNIVGRSAKFSRYIGLPAPGAAGLWGWLLGLLIAGLFVAYCIRIPAVRETAWQVSRLKCLGLVVACGAALCEEVVFRKFLMDALNSRGQSVLLQIAVSSLTFGLLHSIWGLMSGRIAVLVGAMTATSLLGASLAALYLVSHRTLLPCIVAHFLIDAVAEPGLVLAGLRGDMGRMLRPRTTRDEGRLNEAAPAP